MTTEIIRDGDRFLPKREVLGITGYSASTLWREIKAGRFPKAYQLSPNRKGHLQSEVCAWVAKRVKKRTARS